MAADACPEEAVMAADTRPPAKRSTRKSTQQPSSTTAAATSTTTVTTGSSDDAQPPPPFISSQQTPEFLNSHPSIVDDLFATATRCRPQIRRSFTDLEKHSLIKIMQKLVMDIYTVKGNPDQRYYHLLLTIFTIFPVMYCQHRRGGRTGATHYATFLRKRYSECSFCSHAAKHLQLPQEERSTDDRSVEDRVESLARRGKTTLALNALAPSKMAQLTPEVLRQLQALHPRPSADYSKYKLIPSTFTHNVTSDQVKAALKTMSRAAPGLEGWSKEFMRIIIDDAGATVSNFLAEFISDYLNHRLPPSILQFVSSAFGFPLLKDATAVRPITIPCMLNKLAWKIVLLQVNYCPPQTSPQLGLGVKAGCQATALVIQQAINQGFLVIKYDASNCFNSISRAAMCEQLRKNPRYERLWSLIMLNYLQDTFTFYGDGSYIIKTEGINQGGPESSQLMVITTEDLAEQVKFLNIVFAQIIDDIHAIVHPDSFHRVAELNVSIEQYLLTKGLKLNKGKTAYLCQPSIQLPPPFARKDVNIWEVLGAPVLLNPRATTAVCDHLIDIFDTKHAKHYAAMSDIGVRLHYQHLIFHTSTIPSIEYMIHSAWSCYRRGDLEPLFRHITKWYVENFFPPAVLPHVDYSFTEGSSPITQALLYSPVRAGGGLGLLSYELLFYRRMQILSDVVSYCSARFNWFDHNVLCPEEPVFLPPPLQPKGTKQPNSYDKLQHLWFEKVKSVPNLVHHKHWKSATDFRDTSWFKFPPEHKRQIIDDLSLRWSLCTTALVSQSTTHKCDSKALPRSAECNTASGYIDHIQHCPKCANMQFTHRHNTINYAIQRVLRKHGIAYTVEPKGLPVVEDANTNINRPNGPDGLLTTTRDVCAVELHCSHARIFHSPGDTNTPLFHAANRKNTKYNKFEDTYEISKMIFTVSTGGVIAKKTLDYIEEYWKQMADNGGRGMIFELRREISFVTARALGTVSRFLAIKKVQ
jgi:hypothetical protein